MVSFQIPTLISFGTQNLIFIDHKLFEDNMSVISDRFLPVRCVPNAKLLAFDEIFMETNLFSVEKTLSKC